jgi:hypothetical protein
MRVFLSRNRSFRKCGHRCCSVIKLMCRAMFIKYLLFRASCMLQHVMRIELEMNWTLDPSESSVRFHHFSGNLDPKGQMSLVSPRPLLQQWCYHLFQALDVLLFGRLKVFNKYLPKDDNEDREIDHILRIFRPYEGATTSMMIRASWEKAGFSYHQRDGTAYLVVDKGRIRGAPDFCEIWERNYPIESRLAQRRNQKWEWANQQFFRVKYVR